MEKRHAMNWEEIFPQHLNQRTFYMLIIPTSQVFQKWSKYLNRHLSKKISKRHIVTWKVTIVSSHWDCEN